MEMLKKLPELRFSNTYEEDEDFLGNFLQKTLDYEEPPEESFICLAKELISRAGHNAFFYLNKNRSNVYQITEETLQANILSLSSADLTLFLLRDISKIFLTAIQEILRIERQSPINPLSLGTDKPISGILNSASHRVSPYKTCVLLLDDESIIRRQLIRFTGDCVTNPKSDFFQATDCGEALELLALNAHKIGIAFIDDSLPDGIGSVLARDMISKAYPHITLFSVTSNSALKNHFKEFSFDGYLGKPFSKDELDCLLEETFKNQLQEESSTKLWTKPSRDK